jgi:hypothetical protein
MYDKYFPAIRNRKIKMLEIGLGCDMVGYSDKVALFAYTGPVSLTTADTQP